MQLQPRCSLHFCLLSTPFYGNAWCHHRNGTNVTQVGTWALRSFNLISVRVIDPIGSSLNTSIAHFWTLHLGSQQKKALYATNSTLHAYGCKYLKKQTKKTFCLSFRKKNKRRVWAQQKTPVWGGSTCLLFSSFKTRMKIKNHMLLSEETFLRRQPRKVNVSWSTWAVVGLWPLLSQRLMMMWNGFSRSGCALFFLLILHYWRGSSLFFSPVSNELSAKRLVYLESFFSFFIW